ncbi:MAG TPA: DUF2889 domain-containing protein [Telluria sp.]|nr:DUF2889 domain-containing protein [Telluria sp.]
MPLPPPVSRSLRHTRAIEVNAYARDDGLWDLDTRITDVKQIDVTLASGLRPAGTPLHDLSLRLTIDRELTVVDAHASSDSVPYPGFCDTIAPAYNSLVGLSLMKGFRQAVKERLGGVLGCTHLSELAQVLPTAALQAYANDVIKTRDGDTDHELLPHKPFQLDRCHALRTDAGAVAEYYPRWFAKAASGTRSNEFSIQPPHFNSYKAEGKPA